MRRQINNHGLAFSPVPDCLALFGISAAGRDSNRPQRMSLRGITSLLNPISVFTKRAYSNKYNHRIVTNPQSFQQRALQVSHFVCTPSLRVMMRKTGRVKSCSSQVITFPSRRFHARFAENATDRSCAIGCPSCPPSYTTKHFLFFFFEMPTPGRGAPPLPKAIPPPLLPFVASCSRFFRSFATTVRMAHSKISSTPVISLLLHSIYPAPIFWETARPCSVVTGVRPWVLSMSIHVFLYRRSDLRPTRMSGV